jgi:hypothetical protein
MTYQSRHQPRRQTTVTGKVLSPDSYDRFYDIATDALQRGQLRRIRLAAGQLVLRAASGRLTIEQARSIPPNSSMNGDNRYSGPRLDGRPGQGALYVGTLAGVLREHAHYSLRQPVGTRLLGGGHAPPLWQPGTPDTTGGFMQQQKSGAVPPGGQRFHLYRLTQPLQFVDLRLNSLAPLLQGLRASGEGRTRYGIVDWAPLDLLLSAASEAQDYSAARGFADAVYDQRHATGDAGVCAFSARADRDSGLVLETHGDPTGGLVFAIFGMDSTPVQALEPAAPKGQPQLASFDTFDAIMAAMP